MNRAKAIKHIQENPTPSVLIIGGGVNGIGTYRDLALQGIDVFLVEQGDFCSGASAASSHMAHGGVRYLENGEFRLVREAVQERNRLIENAPHYVKPLPTVIPMFKWFSGLFNAPLKFVGLMERPAERGALVIKIGLMFYDAYTRRQGTVPKHQFKFRKAALAEYPRLNPEVLCVAQYYDGSISCPERLCVDMLRDVEETAPEAKAVNYLAAVGAEEDSVLLRDELSGEEFPVTPQIVINAAGPWIDFANQALGINTDLIGGTKGSHLVLDHPELHTALQGKEFFFENEDGRIVLIFPLEDKVLVGTSDLYIENPDDAKCTAEEVEYFLSMLGVVFPEIEVEREQIVFSFSGVRPLPTSDASSAGQVSRDHSVEIINPGPGRAYPIWSLVGGKWTSFRAFSEEVADLVIDYLGAERRQSTRGLAIGGGKGYPAAGDETRAWLESLHTGTGLPLPRLETLFNRYGTFTSDLADFLSQTGQGDTPFEELPSYSHSEVVYLVRREMITHLDDFILRRSLVAMLGQVSPAFLTELAEVVGAELGWSPAQRQDEIERTSRILAENHPK